MTLHTIPLSAIMPPERNPRSSIDPAGIEGLAASIRTDGLLHNLVVTQLDAASATYRLIGGERRFRALQLLAERGELPEDYEVPVSVRNELSEEEALRIATVENLQREPLPPLDEADALTTLARGGERLEELVAKTGLSASTIRRRLRLQHLCAEGREALREGSITLAQAEALTLGEGERQRVVLEHIATSYDQDPEHIRDLLLDGKYPVELAVFPLERYSGTRTRDDLFDEGEYFDDTEQFWELQRQAVAELVETHAVTADWVEITEDYHPSTWSYDEAKDGEPAGVLINLSPGGKVTVLPGLVKRGVDPKLTEAPPVKSRPAYSAVLCRYIAHHKSMAVQCRLLGDARKAKEIAAVAMLYSAGPVRLTQHDCLQSFTLDDQPPFSYRELEREAQACAEALHLGRGEDQAAWAVLLYGRKNATDLYESVKALSDAVLDRLLLLLPVLCFGQVGLDGLDTGDTLFNRVAQDLGMDMRAYWRPDMAFFTRRTRDQLMDIARDAGLAASRAWKKSELVSRLLRHFEEAHATTSDADTYQKARDWLPEAMRFPAVDPLAGDSPVEDNSAEDDPTEEDEAWKEAA